MTADDDRPRGPRPRPRPTAIRRDEIRRIVERDRPILDRLAQPEERDKARAVACVDLAEFLLARYVERETLANALLGRIEAYEALRPRVHVASTGSPAMMLADVATKRRLVDRCRPRYVVMYDQRNRLHAELMGWPTFKAEAWSTSPVWPFPQAEAILLDLGTEFADHPDFLEAWKP